MGYTLRKTAPQGADGLSAANTQTALTTTRYVERIMADAKSRPIPSTDNLTETEAVLAVLRYAAQGPEHTFWVTCWFEGYVSIDDAANAAWQHLLALSRNEQPPALDADATAMLCRIGFNPDQWQARANERARVSLLLDSMEAAEGSGTTFRVLEHARTVA